MFKKSFTSLFCMNYCEILTFSKNLRNHSHDFILTEESLQSAMVDIAEFIKDSSRVLFNLSF